MPYLLGHSRPLCLWAYFVGQRGLTPFSLKDCMKVVSINLLALEISELIVLKIPFFIDFNAKFIKKRGSKTLIKIAILNPIFENLTSGLIKSSE